MTAQVIQFVLRTAGIVVLARLLTPNDYGLIGMVAVVIGFAQMFKDAGLSMATVQKDHISHEQISTLFWINILISAFLGVCVLAGSPLVARFYGRPELRAVTAALSFSFIISGLMIQHQALLRRHMQFGMLAIIQIASQVITLVVTIILALLGWRYWALVGGTITTALVSTLMTFFFCPWIPGRMKKVAGVRDMLKFGGYLTGYNFVNYFARNLDNILIGRFVGATQLGFYSKAYQLLMLPIGQVRSPLISVAIPAMSTLQDNPQMYRRYFHKIISLIGLITMPMAGLFFVCPDNIILLVLGHKWIKASAIFRVLSLVAFIQPAATAAIGVVMISLGHGRSYFRFGVFSAIFICLGISLGLRWGAIGVACGYVAAYYLILFPALPYCLKGSSVKSSDFLKAIYLPATASVIMVNVMIIMKSYMLDLNNLGIIALSFFVGTTAYVAVLLIMPGGAKSLFEHAAMMKSVFRKRNQIT